MRRFAIFASLFLTLSACACKKVQASGDENDKKVLRDWISAFNKAMCEKDTKTLDILMDDETMRYYNIDVTTFECSVEGNRALVKTTNVIEARIWGSHGTWTLNGTTYLRRADNKYGWVRCNPE